MAGHRTSAAIVLARVADNIAYRAIRNRGTIGGSVCHADPAADWVTVLTALNAVAVLQGAAGTRSVPSRTRARDIPHRTAAGRDTVCGTNTAPAARFALGYVKACRKPGDFAHAMAAVLLNRADPARGDRRTGPQAAVAGKTKLRRSTARHRRCKAIENLDRCSVTCSSPHCAARWHRRKHESRHADRERRHGDRQCSSRARISRISCVRIGCLPARISAASMA